MDLEQSKATLHASLQQTREHALTIVDGLDEEAFRRPVLPSGWSCADMITHLTWDEEIFWFQAVVAGDADAIALLQTDEAKASWSAPPGLSVAEVVERYRTAIARSDAIIAATALDAAPAWWPGDLFGDFRLNDLNEVLLHLIVEIACHAGHLDATRELIDGHQFLVLTD